MRVSNVLDRARGELGYTEWPPGSNITKYEAHAYEHGAQWCGTFVNWLFAPWPRALPGSMHTTSVGADYFRHAHRFADARLERARAGDVVFMTFNRDGTIEHVGIVESVDANGAATTIEGNTSTGLAGSQNNGGIVARRRRSGLTVVGYGRMEYDPPEDDEMATKTIRDRTTGEINTYANGARRPFAFDDPADVAGNLEKIDELAELGLVETPWLEMPHELFMAIPLA